jgi:hypothetical protein
MSEDNSEGYTVEVSTSSKGNEVTRYKLNGQLVKASEVPEEVKAGLSAPSEEAPVVSEDEIVSADEIDEPEEASEQPEDVNEDEEAETEEEPVPAPVVELDSPDDIDDESGVDEELAPAPKPVESDEEGMGFPRVDGKTVDIFDGKTPHTHIRIVGNLVVPLSEKNYNTKSDADIIKVLKKLGKI